MEIKSDKIFISLNPFDVLVIAGIVGFLGYKAKGIFDENSVRLNISSKNGTNLGIESVPTQARAVNDFLSTV